MRLAFYVVLCGLPLAAFSVPSSLVVSCIPADSTLDPVRFDIDESAQTVTLFKTGETFVLVENTPTQLTFEEGDPQGELTLNYIAKVNANTPGDWVADTIGADGNLVSKRRGVCFAL